MKDARYMREALELALRGRGRVSPNPLVGALVVRGGRVIGRGWHDFFGGPHAEINALAGLKPSALRGAVLYVTLEPCSTSGKTPPCTRAILKSGIRRVVVAVADPNPAHAGRGLKILERAGIEVVCGVLEKEARALNAPFFKYQTTGLPYVRLKMAQTLDGKTATRQRQSKWITGAESRGLVRGLRAAVDAVLVGAGTLRADDPVLLPNDWAEGRKPWRLVVDPKLSAPPSAKIFQDKAETRVILICRRDAGPQEKIALLRKKKIQVLRVLDGAERAGLAGALKQIARGHGIIDILCEGGSELAGALIDQRLADYAMFFVAPKIFGGRTAPTAVGGEGVGAVDYAAVLREPAVKTVGGDVLVEGEIGYPAGRETDFAAP